MRLAREAIFDSEMLGRDLAQKSVRSGLATLSGQSLRAAIQMVGTVVLARLLSPDDYGLVGMVTVVVGFALMFKDAGLSMATVQRREITHEQISSLFWVNLAVSLTLGLAVLAASPLVSAFYGRGELTAITAALSASFVVSGVSIQHEALLRRHMRFTALAVSQVLGQAVSVAVSTIGAVSGLSYWSLVLGTLSASFVTTGLALYFCPWIPGRLQRGVGAKSMLRFGTDIMSFNFVNYFARNADNILIGRFIGAEPLGLYARAYSLFMLPITQIRTPMNDVAMPALASLRTEPERYAAYYRRFLEVLAVLTVPMATYCLIEADPHSSPAGGFGKELQTQSP